MAALRVIEVRNDLPPVNCKHDLLNVSVRGRFVRKRNLSYAIKGLVFGDIQLQDGELLEVMIRAEKGILDLAAVRQINRDVHLGDLITAYGTLQRKLHELGNLDGWMLILHSMRVDELWSLRHADTVFSYTDLSGVSSPDAAAVNGSWVLPPSSKAEAVNKYTNMVVIDGFNACKFYFSSSGGANCLRGKVCHFWHGQPEHFAENRRRWMKKRLEQRAKAAHLAGDTIDPHFKIDKAQRSRIFCDWLVSSVGMEQLAGGTGVIDIAGGKGDIPTQLWIQRGIPTTLIDPVRSDGPIEKRPMKLGKHNRKLVAKAEAATGRKMSPQLLRRLDDETLRLHTELFADCSLLVGMHPDEATEAIVDIALALDKPFAIVPCCVMSRVFPDRTCVNGTPVDTYETFVKYLLEKHPSVQSAFLPFAGRNQVLYLFDYGKGRYTGDGVLESTSTKVQVGTQILKASP